MVLAVVELRKIVTPPNSFVIEVMPDVSALTISKTPSLVTAPRMLAVWVASPSCRVEQPQIVVPPL